MSTANPNPRFVLAHGGPRNGSFRGYVTASYKALREKFSVPSTSNSDGYKISTSWYILDRKTGIVFEVYDYKETNLYSDSLPSVRAFRMRPSYEWHIGYSGHITDEVITAFSQFVNGEATNGTDVIIVPQ